MGSHHPPLSASRAAAEEGREEGRKGGSRHGRSPGGGVWGGDWSQTASPGAGPGFPPGVGRFETASVNAPPRSSSAGPSSAAGGSRNADPARTAPQLSGGRRRHTKNAVSGGRGERERQIQDGYSSPRPLAPLPPPGSVRGRGDNATSPARSARHQVRDAALPTWPSPGSPAPSGPGKGRHLVPAAGEGRLPATAEPGNLQAGKSLRRLRGAARRGATRPSCPRSPPVTFSTRRQPGPRRPGLRGGPASVRGPPHPGLLPGRVAAEKGKERKITMQEEISRSGHYGRSHY
ncbi:uncharacterized protein ACIGJ3_008949 [Trichechus inunguis]